MLLNGAGVALGSGNCMLVLGGGGALLVPCLPSSSMLAGKGRRGCDFSEEASDEWEFDHVRVAIPVVVAAGSNGSVN